MEKTVNMALKKMALTGRTAAPGIQGAGQTLTRRVKIGREVIITTKTDQANIRDIIEGTWTMISRIMNRTGTCLHLIITTQAMATTKEAPTEGQITSVEEALTEAVTILRLEVACLIITAITTATIKTALTSSLTMTVTPEEASTRIEEAAIVIEAQEKEATTIRITTVIITKTALIMARIKEVTSRTIATVTTTTPSPGPEIALTTIMKDRKDIAARETIIIKNL